MTIPADTTPPPEAASCWMCCNSSAPAILHSDGFHYHGAARCKSRAWINPDKVVNTSLPPAPPPDADDATRLAKELREQLERLLPVSDPTMPILKSRALAIADQLDALAATRAAMAQCEAESRG